MKHLKLFLLPLLAMTLVFSSCESNRENEICAAYSIKCEVTNGYKQTLRIFECNDQGEKLYDHTIEKTVEGKTYYYTAQYPYITKIKIHVSVESVAGDYQKWVQRVYYLDKNKTTEIILNGNTTIGKNEP